MCPPLSRHAAHQRFTGADPKAVPDAVAEPETIGSQDDDGRAVLEPSQFLALAHAGIAGIDGRRLSPRVDDQIEKVQADAGHQNGRDRHQGQRIAGGRAQTDDGPLVLAEQPLDALERDRIHVPGVAADRGDLVDPAIGRRVKAVIHARRQPQGDEAAVAVGFHQCGIAQQVQQGIGRALDLEQLGVGDGAEGADDAVAGARQHGRIGIERPQAGAQLPGETVVQAGEAGFPGLAEIEVRKQPPAGDRQVADPGMFDLAEPAHEVGQRRARDAVGQQEVDVLLLGQGGDKAAHCHDSVSGAE